MRFARRQAENYGRVPNALRWVEMSSEALQFSACDRSISSYLAAR